MFGIDVSEYQGRIQWERVKPQIDFAIIRLGWISGVGGHRIDNYFERNYRECRRLGIPIGTYVYCYSNSPAEASSGGRWAVEMLDEKTLDLPVFIDMEEESLIPLGQQALTQICISFNTVIERSGLWAGVYANENWFVNYLNSALLRQKYVSWIAAYHPGTDSFKGEYDMWQNSDAGRIAGITDNVDTDYMYRDLIRDIRDSGGGTPPSPKPPAQVTTYVVQPGDTLSGIAERFHTTWQELARINHIKDPNLIYVGQVLKV